MLCSIKLIFQATVANVDAHCGTSASSRKKRATEELTTLPNGLMTEAMQAGQESMENVRLSKYLICVVPSITALHWILVISGGSRIVLRGGGRGSFSYQKI